MCINVAQLHIYTYTYECCTMHILTTATWFDWCHDQHSDLILEKSLGDVQFLSIATLLCWFGLSTNATIRNCNNQPVQQFTSATIRNPPVQQSASAAITIHQCNNPPMQQSASVTITIHQCNNPPVQQSASATIRNPPSQQSASATIHQCNNP